MMATRSVRKHRLDLLHNPGRRDRDLRILRLGRARALAVTFGGQVRIREMEEALWGRQLLFALLEERHQVLNARLGLIQLLELLPMPPDGLLAELHLDLRILIEVLRPLPPTILPSPV